MKPEHEKTMATTNQGKTSHYRPGRQDKNEEFCTTVDPSKTKLGKIYSDICRRFPTTSSKRNKYIYIMCVYTCNDILTIAMKNKIDKEIIKAFK